MADPFPGEVRIFAFDFVPRHWAKCDGSALTTAQNPTLYGAIGTTYGSPAAGSYNLPNIIGRVVIGAGQGPGLSLRDRGETGGVAEVTLLAAQMPAHNHRLRANVTDPGDVNVPSPSGRLAVSTGGTFYQASSNGTLASNALGSTGGNTAHNNMQPSLHMNFCISLSGI